MFYNFATTSDSIEEIESFVVFYFCKTTAKTPIMTIVKSIYINKLFFTFIPFLLIFSFSVFSQSKTTSVVEQLVNDPDLRNASLGICVLDVETGKTVFEHNAHASLKPASTLKVVTTATALGVLGEDFQFETLLQYDGSIDAEGTLNGNLYIKGGGDPTLGFMRDYDNDTYEQLLDKWLNAIKAEGIKKITGAVIGDPSIFESSLVPQKWIWEDIGNYYGAGASGLNLHENQYNIQFQPAASVGGETKVVYITPPMDGIEFINEVKTGKKGSGDQAIVYASPYTERIFIRGTVPVGKKFGIKGSIPDPAYFAAQSLNRILEKNSIDIVGCPSTLAKYNSSHSEQSIGDNRTNFHTTLSPPLDEIVFYANKKSINLYCEAMLKMIGYKLYGAGYGTTEWGVQGVEAYWKNRGVNLNGFYMNDGSGLSPDNAVSTYHLASILREAYEEESYKDSFDESLSFAGVSGDKGSLRGQLVGTKAQGNLRAKSGYISRVRSYSGYVMDECGHLLSFSVIVNNYNCGNSAMRVKLMEVLKSLAEM